MEDRKASFMAAAAGCFAVGGFWLARPTGKVASIRVFEQRVFPPEGYGLDVDAAAAFRVEIPRVVREALDDNVSVAYRLVDRRGRTYPLSVMADPRFSGALKLSQGYAERPESPRLEVASDGKVLASVAVDDVPEPRPIALPPASDAPVALLYRGGGWLDVEPKSPIPRNERWQVLPQRTRFVSLPEASAELPTLSARWPSHRLQLAFADQAEAVEIEFVRYRLSKVATVVRIPNLRLTRRFGGSMLRVDHITNVPNDFGARIFLPRQDFGPRRPLRHEDPRIATVSVGVVPPWSMPPRRPGLRRDRPPTFEILSPSAEALGLRELRIGTGVRRAKAEPNKPVQEGPFDAVVRLTFTEPTVVERRRMVVPIETAPRPWPQVNRFAFGP